MQLFDNAMREFGGMPVEAPSWETTPANFPIKTLPWAAFMDASDNAFLVKTGSDVYKWRSAVFHPTPIPGIGAFRFTGFAQGTYPTIGGGTANPAGSQHISFDGVSQYFRSGAINQMGQRWDINTYSATAGGGGNEGSWVSDTTTYTFSQTTPARVPDLALGGPRAVAANSDYLTSNATLGDLFPGGTSGTITFALYADAAAAPAFGTNVAQTPWANPAFMMDNSGYLGVHFTTSGVTVGAYDGVARDSGGGPGTNDGWQMVTAALAISTKAIVQVRWGAGTTLLELRVITSAGWGAWQTCAFSAISYTAGVVQLFTEYSTSMFQSGLIAEMATSPSRLDDVYADEDVRYTAARVGYDISLFNTRLNDAEALFGKDEVDTYSHGFETFTVGRANSRTTTPNAYAAKSFWQTSGAFVGLGSITNGGQARWAPNLADNTGGANFKTEHAIADNTWALVSARLSEGTLISRKNGDKTTDVSTALTSAAPFTYVSGQSLTIGYAVGAADYLQGAMSFLGYGATTGWSDARRRDVERWLIATYLTGGVSAYSMTATAAAFVLAGSATGLTKQKKITNTVGAFALNGSATGFLRGRRMVATQASFALNGSATGLTKQKKITNTVGAFALNGSATGLTKQKKITNSVGAFALNGSATAFVTSRRITNAVGAFALNGSATNFLRARRMVAAIQTYALSGSAALFVKGSRMLAAQVSFVLNGNAASLSTLKGVTASVGAFVALFKPATFDVKLPVSTGAFAISTYATGLRAQRKLPVSNGAFALAGLAVGFGVKLPVSNGAFALSGSATTFRSTRRITTSVGVFLEAGGAVNLTKTRGFVAGVGAFTLAGQLTGLRKNSNLAATTRAFALAGLAVGFGVAMPATSRSYALTGAAAALRASRVFPMGSAAFALTGSSAGLTTQRRAILAAGSFALAGQAIDFATGKVLLAGSRAYLLTASAAGLRAQRTIALDHVALALDGMDAGLLHSVLFKPSSAAFTLDGMDAAFTYLRGIDPSAGVFALDGSDALFEHVGTIRLLVDRASYELTLIDAQLRPGFILGVSIDRAMGPETMIAFDDGAAFAMTLDHEAGTEISIMTTNERSDRFYDVGDVIEVSATIYRRRTDALVDPDALVVSVLPPDGAQYAITYDGIDARVVRDALGQYRALIDATMAGEYVIQFNGTGVGQAMQSTSITVRAPRIVV